MALPSPAPPAPRLAIACAAVCLPLLAPLGAWATEPCGDFGECKALVEINASDGDIGFHFLVDGDDLNEVFMEGPASGNIFHYQVKGALRDQKLTETFAESAEPPCRFDPEGFVTLEEFLERWPAGSYSFYGKGDNGERLIGETELTHVLPAAPAEVDFDGSQITWEPGEDLGDCATEAELDDLVDDGALPVHPADVAVAAWEVVMVPDVDGPLSALSFVAHLPGGAIPLAVTVPADYLAALPAGTPLKLEVGAIGVDDNATFTEEDGF